MVEYREPLFDKKQTSDFIKNLVAKYYSDLDRVEIEMPEGFKKASAATLEEIYNHVRAIPYRRDKAPLEIISRPFHILKYQNLGMDCKKKCIVLAAWAKYQGIPCRYIGSSARKDKKIHHIFPQFKIKGEWRNIDATYPEYSLFEPKTVTKAEVL